MHCLTAAPSTWKSESGNDQYETRPSESPVYSPGPKAAMLVIAATGL